MNERWLIASVILGFITITMGIEASFQLIELFGN
jgi:hypothetical protein